MLSIIHSPKIKAHIDHRKKENDEVELIPVTFKVVHPQARDLWDGKVIGCNKCFGNIHAMLHNYFSQYITTYLK